MIKKGITKELLKRSEEILFQLHFEISKKSLENLLQISKIFNNLSIENNQILFGDFSDQSLMQTLRDGYFLFIYLII